MFKTSSTYYGKLGGLAGADSICASRAQVAGLQNQTWKAVLGTPSETITNRIAINGPVYNLRGQVVFGNAVDFTNGFLLTTNIYTEYLNLSSYYHWAGAQNSSYSSYHCNYWTSSSSSYTGYYGYHYYSGTYFYRNSTRACNNPYPILCISQSLQPVSTPAPTSPPVPTLPPAPTATPTPRPSPSATPSPTPIPNTAYTFSTSSSEVSEGGKVTITVTRSGPLPAVDIEIALSGSALINSDFNEKVYYAGIGEIDLESNYHYIFFESGQSSIDITFTALSDALVEGSENAILTLKAVPNGFIINYSPILGAIPSHTVKIIEP